MNLFRLAVADHADPASLEKQFFQSVHVSGGHMNSMKIVGQNGAAAASVDDVTFSLAQRSFLFFP